MTDGHIMNNSHKDNSKSERRRKEQLARRNTIIKAAREVFFAKGFMVATVDEIADRCGLAKGTIYLYFQSKEEIYVSIMAEGMGRLLKELQKAKGIDARDDELIELALQAYYRFYLSNRKYFRIMFLSTHPNMQTRVPETLLKGCMDTAVECLGVVRDLVQKGIEKGIYRKVDPWVVANILWATVSGIIMGYEQDPIYREQIVGMGLEEMLRYSCDLATEGLRVKR
jgi:AcrR family transcriptional regulator